MRKYRNLPRRSLLLLLSLALALPLLSGCSYSTEPTRLNERAVVEAVGIDFENGEYTVTLLLYKPTDENAQSTNDTSLESAAGQSVSEALEKIAATCGKIPFFNNNRILILGRGAVEERLDTLLEFFDTDPRIKPACRLLMAEETARALLSPAQGDHGSPLEQGFLNAVLDAAVSEGRAFDTTVLSLRKSRADEGRDAALSVVRADGKGIVFSGAQCLCRLSPTRRLSEEETRGALLLLGEAKHPTVTARTASGVVSAVGYGLSVDWELQDPASPAATLTVSLSFPPAEGAAMGHAAVQAALQAEVTRLCEAALRAIRAADCDLLCVGARYRLLHARALKKRGQTVRAVSAACSLSVRAKVTLDARG